MNIITYIKQKVNTFKYHVLLGIFLLLAVPAAAITVLYPVDGGTGTYITPSLGDLLVGNSNGVYEASSTPYLGSINVEKITVSSTTATSTFSGNVKVDGNLEVDGVALFSPVSSGNLTVNGTLTINDNIILNGNWLSGDGGDEGVFVSSTGNVGIGTTAPNYRLSVGTGTGNHYMQLLGNDSSELGLLFSSAATTNRGAIFYDQATNYMSLRTNGNEKVRIDSNGNVGIGTTTPGAKLDVLGTVRSSTGNPSYYADFIAQESANLPFKLTSQGGTLLSYGDGTADNRGVVFLNAHKASGTNRGIAFQYAGATKMFMEGITGNVGIGTTTPSEKLHIMGAYRSDTAVAVNTASDVLMANSVGSGFRTPAAKLQVQRGTNLGQGWNFLVAANTTGTVSEAMRITTEGLVGIGTTTPNVLLSVGSGGQYPLWAPSAYNGIYVNPNLSGAQMTVESNGGYEGGIVAHSGGNIYMGSWSNSPLIFRVNNTDRMTISTTGNVGIGTTTPSEKLQIGATSITEDDVSVLINSGNAKESKIKLRESTAGFGFDLTYEGEDTQNQFYISGVNSGVATHHVTVARASGNVGIGTTSPYGKLSLKGTGTTSGKVLVTSDSSDAEKFSVTDAGLVKTSSYVYANRFGAGFGSAALPSYNFINDGGTAGGDNTGFFQPTIDNIGISINGTELHRFTSGGNFGIGTTSPSTKLDVYGGRLHVTNDNSGAGSEQLWLSGSTNNNKRLRLGYNTTSNYGVIQAITVGSSYDNLILNPDGGNVGIGTTDPKAMLELRTGTSPTFLITSNSAAASDAGAIQFASANDSTDTRIQLVNDESANTLRFDVRNTSASAWTPAMSIIRQTAGLGNVGIGTTSPTALLHIYKDINSDVTARLDNINAGAGALGAYSIYNGTGAGDYGRMELLGTGYGVGQGLSADTLAIESGSGISNGINLITRASAPIRFYTGNYTDAAQRMIIGSTGNVGIGTTSPQSKLHILGEKNTTALKIAQPTVSATNDYIGLAFTWDPQDRTLSAIKNVWENPTSNYSSALTFETLNTSSVLGEKMRITAAGNVGIGTTAPTSPLHILGGFGDQLTLSNTVANNVTKYSYIGTQHYTTTEEDMATFLGISDASVSRLLIGGGTSYMNAATSLEFYTGTDTTTITGGRRMTITSGGDVGIGSSTPNAKLTISSGTSGAALPVATSDHLVLEDDGNTFMNILTPANAQGGILFSDTTRARGQIIYDHTTDSLRLFTLGSEKLRIGSTGLVGIGTTTPVSNLDVYGTLRATNTSLPTCDATLLGAIQYDESDDHFYGCRSTGWTQLDN
jgi:hypothetical protein